MNSKHTLIDLLLLGSLILTISCTNLTYEPGQAPKIFTGISEEWQTYNDHGIMIDIDFSLLNLKNIPQVHTSIYGNRSHWDTTGASSIYQLTNKGFRVYIKGVDFTATVENAKEYKWKLAYTIITQDS